MDAVTQILLDRSREVDNITRLVVVSFVAHVLIIAAIAFVPANWGHHNDNAPVMTIELGGAPGPVQGRNQISAKPVQEAAPPTAKPEPQAPPALAKPEMVEPLKTARPQPKAPAKTAPEKIEPQLHSRTPTKGAEVKEGSARVDTGGAAVPFGGLATSGGQGNGAAYTDVQNFCCPEYLLTMTRLIQSNWNQRQGQDGSNQVKFTILRDGTITDAQIETPNVQFLDLESLRAVLRTKRLPPLPAQYTGDRLTVHLVFQYKR